MRRQEGGDALDQGDAGDEGLRRGPGCDSRRTRRCCRACRWSARRPESGSCAARSPCRRWRWRRRTSRRRRGRGSAASRSAAMPAARRRACSSSVGRQIGPVALQHVLVIGIAPARADQAERLGQPPAVGHRDMLGRKGLGRRRPDRARIVLVDRIGKVVLRMPGRRRPSISSSSKAAAAARPAPRRAERRPARRSGASAAARPARRAQRSRRRSVAHAGRGSSWVPDQVRRRRGPAAAGPPADAISDRRAAATVISPGRHSARSCR